MSHAPAFIDRGLASVIVCSTLISASLVALACYVVARLEFCASVVGRAREFHAPPVTLFYRGVYPYSVGFLVFAVVGAAWILRSRTCPARAIAVYVAVVVNVALLWLLLTAVALYCQNQAFYS